MPTLRHTGKHLPDYAGPLVEGRWRAGEVREVSPEVAAYLLGEMGGEFEPAEAPAPATLDDVAVQPARDLGKRTRTRGRG